MKNFKNTLRIILTFASLIGFLGGWVSLAHSRKPIQPSTNQSQIIDPLPPLAPLPDLGSVTTSNNSNNNLNIIVPQNNTTSPVFPQQNQGRSFFQTGGS